MMSAVGFAPLPPQDSELEKLRETCKRLNYAIRAIKEAQDCLAKMNIGEARKSLNNATWQAREAKKTLAEVGQAKRSHRSIRTNTDLK